MRDMHHIGTIYVNFKKIIPRDEKNKIFGTIADIFKISSFETLEEAIEQNYNRAGRYHKSWP